MPRHDPPRFHIDIASTKRDGEICISVNGWVCSRSEAHKVVMTVGEQTFRAPIGYPRPDVHAAINADKSYPFMRSYFCGVNAEFVTTANGLPANGGLAQILTAGGDVLAQLAFDLSPDGKASIGG